MSSKKEKVFYNFIDKIFWEQWDPVGINKDIKARNEYYGYIPIVFSEALKHENENHIASLLFSIEKDRMGLEGNYEKCLIVAKKILNEKLEIFR